MERMLFFMSLYFHREFIFQISFHREISQTPNCELKHKNKCLNYFRIFKEGQNANFQKCCSCDSPCAYSMETIRYKSNTLTFKCCSFILFTLKNHFCECESHEWIESSSLLNHLDCDNSLLKVRIKWPWKSILSNWELVSILFQSYQWNASSYK